MKCHRISTSNVDSVNTHYGSTSPGRGKKIVLTKPNQILNTLPIENVYLKYSCEVIDTNIRIKHLHVASNTNVDLHGL